MKNILYLHIGSNVGKRRSFLEFARQNISGSIGKITATSAVYQTKAWGKKDQADFLNQAIEAETDLSPFEVLAEIKRIEKESGRKKHIRWGERTLDIDILFYNDAIINTKDLTVPHPLLHKRNFVLVPLTEIASNFIHPVKGKTVNDLLCSSPDELEVIKIDVEKEKTKGR